MTVLTKNFIESRSVDRSIKKAKPKISLWDRYMTYAKSKEEERIYWYMKVIIAIPCVVMVPAIFLMAMATPNYIWFVGLSIILFFGNVISFIAEVKSTTFVPLFHITAFILFLIPIITSLINL